MANLSTLRSSEAAYGVVVIIYNHDLQKILETSWGCLEDDMGVISVSFPTNEATDDRPTEVSSEIFKVLRSGFCDERYPDVTVFASISSIRPKRDHEIKVYNLEIGRYFLVLRPPELALEEGLKNLRKNLRKHHESNYGSS